MCVCVCVCGVAIGVLLFNSDETDNNNNLACVYVYYLVGERDTLRGNTIENWGCLFIYILYVWTYVCHFVL